jgi:ClpP class serine protease
MKAISKIPFPFKSKVFPTKIVAKFHVNDDINRASCVKLQKAMEKAFKSKGDVQAVALVINSRGGSPVYSDLMAQKVVSYAKSKNVPLYTFAESIAASGGYWLLAVGNPGKVYANNSSIVGSVGVVAQAAATKKLLDHWHFDRIQITTGE